MDKNLSNKPALLVIMSVIAVVLLSAAMYWLGTKSQSAKTDQAMLEVNMEELDNGFVEVSAETDAYSERYSQSEMIDESNTDLVKVGATYNSTQNCSWKCPSGYRNAGGSGYSMNCEKTTVETYNAVKTQLCNCSSSSVVNGVCQGSIATGHTYKCNDIYYCASGDGDPVGKKCKKTKVDRAPAEKVCTTTGGTQNPVPTSTSSQTNPANGANPTPTISANQGANNGSGSDNPGSSSDNDNGSNNDNDSNSDDNSNVKPETPTLFGRLTIADRQCANSSTGKYGYAQNRGVRVSVESSTPVSGPKTTKIIFAKKDGASYTKYGTQTPAWCSKLGGTLVNESYCRVLDYVSNTNSISTYARNYTFSETGTYVAMTNVSSTNSPSGNTCSGNPICSSSKSPYTGKVSCAGFASCDNGSHARAGFREYKAQSIEFIVYPVNECGQ